MNNFLLTFQVFLLSSMATSADWIIEKQSGYTYHYTKQDQSYTKDYQNMLNTGMGSVEGFFSKPFPKPFDVFVHPTRQSWDTKFQTAYQMPDFKSECWMVASGDGFQLNMISPATWDTAACEHTYADKVHTQQLLTHELFHVFHGQLNASPDFMEFEGLDWLAEGFATYASGQLTESRLEEVRKLVEENKAPATLDDFWKGKHRYGLSGSVVRFIDKKFGRSALLNLLALRKKSEVLETLQISEHELITAWSEQISTLTAATVD
jgi:hypothetical protein